MSTPADTEVHPTSPDPRDSANEDARRRWYPQTLRARITAVVVAGTSVLVTVALGLLYLGLTAELHAAVDDGLRARVQDISSLSLTSPTRPIPDPYAQIVTRRGAVLAASTTAPETVVMAPNELSAAQHGLVLADQSAPGLPGPARLAAKAIPGTNRVAIAGTSLTGVEATKDRLLIALGIALVGLIALLALIVRWTISASLRPVAALSRRAARISTAGSTTRLPQPQGEDEIAELATTLNAMLDRLQASFERERAFVDDASHELRTPIAVLRGELELALLNDDPTQMRRAVQIAQAEAEHISNLAVDLLVLARQRAGTLLLQRTRVDLLASTEHTLKRLRSVLDADLSIQGTPVQAHVDVSRLDQLLTNLVTNAVQAGAQHVDVRVTQAGNHAVLDIEDDGPGFPEDLLPAALDRFTRTDPARTRSGRSRTATTGTGLGLPIAAAITQAHGGQISITNSDAHGGASVRVQLPLHGDGPPLGRT
jgi:two-component system OmpR family sensor kinase